MMELFRVLCKIYFVIFIVNGFLRLIMEIWVFDVEIMKVFGVYFDMEQINWLVFLDFDLEKIYFKWIDIFIEEEVLDVIFIKEGGNIQEFENGNLVKND